MPDIHAVTLDLWQTLIVDQPEWGRARARLRILGAVEALRDAGEVFTKEQVRQAYRTCFRICRSIREEGRDVSFEGQVQIFVRAIAQRLPERVGQDTFERILSRYADAFYESPPVLAEGVPEMLATLKEQGYLLGLISNTGMTPGRLFRSYLKELGIVHYFDHLTFSDEVLLAKPVAAIFVHTLKGLGASSEQAVHVGDHLRLDILGGQRAGMKTVWVQGFDAGETEATPDVTIQHIAELPRALERLNEGAARKSP